MVTSRHKDTLFAATFIKRIDKALIIPVKNVLSFGAGIAILSKSTNFARRSETI